MALARPRHELPEGPYAKIKGTIVQVSRGRPLPLARMGHLHVLSSRVTHCKEFVSTQ
jgi:hypothetical protein